MDTENIPDYSNDSNGYVKYMESKYGYEREKISSLTMKTRQYVSVAVVETDKHIGVIVFESESGDKFKTQKVAQIKKHCQSYQGYMVDFIKGGIKYDRSAKINLKENGDPDEEFLSIFRNGRKA